MAARKRQRDDDKSSAGLPIWARFTLSMAIALTLVSSGAGFLLYQTVRQVGANVQQQTLLETVQLTAPQTLREIERQRVRAEREVFFDLEQQLGKDAAQAVKDAGYKTTSRSFYVQVVTALAKGGFKRVTRGRYTAK